MNNETKLINCGGTVFIYESRNGSSFAIENENGMKIDKLKFSLLTNFVTDKLLVGFRLKIALSEYGGVKERLQQFINELMNSTKSKKISYIAVTCPPTIEDKNNAMIYLVTSLDYLDLTYLWEDEDSEDMRTAYYESKWKNELSIEGCSDKQLIETFTTVYKEGLNSKVFGTAPIKFSGNLKSPQVLYDEEANQYMIKNEVLNYQYFYFEEFFSKKAGFYTFYEYSN